MGGIALRPSRLATTRAALAAMALLAATPPAESGVRTRVTIALARQALHGAGAALPRPLEATDAARLRRIFAAQRKGDLPRAKSESEQLDTTTPLGQTMLGEVLSDRYLSRFYHPSAAELSGWMLDFGDQPEARAVHQLLLQQLPKGAAPPEPLVPKWAVKANDAAIVVGADPAVSAPRNPGLERTLRERAAAGQGEGAVRLIAATHALSRPEAAPLRAEVARALFTSNNSDAALDVAKAALKDGGPAGLAGYIAGLASWRAGQSGDARLYFEIAATAEQASAALRSAGAFWAARAHQRAGNLETTAFWLMRAAAEPNTFYGLLARRALGTRAAAQAVRPKPREVLGQADLDAVSAAPEGLAAFALLQLGESDRAEAELRRLDVRMCEDARMQRAISLIARKAGLRDLMLRTAAQTAAAGAGASTSGLAVAGLQPLDGFRVDPALVYALARVESNFDASAVSPAGARGLMQLMPETATSMAGDAPLEESSLNDPETNLELAQRYVLYLAKQPVSRDLVRLLASYNAGPGRTAAWDIRDGGDPLLFIESIPLEETRVFVQRALAFSWLYAARFDLPAPSLDELAAGSFPRFHDVSELKPPVEEPPAARPPAARSARRHR